VDYIYKAWLALQKRLQYQLDGKTRWLEMLKSDAELVEATGSTLDSLRIKAAEILTQHATLAQRRPTLVKNQKGRLCVEFNGLSEYTFEVYCDKRQLHWFQRFLEDQQIKRDSKNQHSSSLFTLRSGRIAWQEQEGKGDPWNVHRLTLYCSIDTRLWTQEGTEQVREEKASEIAKTLTAMKEKGNLNEKQQAFIKRKNSTLAVKSTG
jgi:hypothetical protein